MIKQQIKVPADLKFISDWNGYQIPYGRCVIDKKVCGCGYTQFCLTNCDNIILCSPRISLLENKAEQNPECFYVKSRKISSKERKAKGLVTEADISNFLYAELISGVKAYVEYCVSYFKPCKFLITYDSLSKLIDVLNSLSVNLSRYKVVIDEFQLIFGDARFKAETELDFIRYLNHYCPNSCFLSSTPMLEEYLEQVPEFQDLTYYEFIWDSSRVILPNINYIKTSNIEQSALEIIDLYKNGLGPTKIVDGMEYKSQEAVLYVNNVSMITSLIKKSGLTPDDVNIIVSKTSENLKKIKKCGKGFDIGNAPMKGNSHKLITLCSATAYCGIDMYNTSAKSYVFSNCNLKTMSVDISLELPQIVGRQRLPENKFRYDVTFFYSECIGEYTREDFELEMNKKKSRTEEKINNFNVILSTLGDINIDIQRSMIRSEIKVKQYSEDFCGISRDTGLPVLNNLVLLSEIRAWELQNLIYNNDASVLRILCDVGHINEQENSLNAELEKIASEPYFENRMKLVLNYIQNHPGDISNLPDKYKVFFENIGVNEIISGSLRKDALNKRIVRKEANENIFKIKNSKEVSSKVFFAFKEGNSYTRKEIKEELTKIFSGYGIVAKASDIKNYFEAKRISVKEITSGKYEEGFRLIKKIL